MKRLLLFAIGVLASVQLSAQQQLHLSINSGIGKIGYKLYPGEIAHGIRLEDKYSATFGINLSYSYGFGDFHLESGLSYNDLKGNQSEGVNEIEILGDGSSRIIQKDRLTESKAHYLTIPLKLNYHIEKLQVGAGLYFSSMISNRYYAVEFTDGVYSGSNSNESSMSNFDFGLSAQIAYELSDRASLLFSTNYGLIDINTRSTSGEQYPEAQIGPSQRFIKNRQFMVGLKFRLYKS